MDQRQAPRIDVLSITLTFHGHTGCHQADVSAAGDDWCAHGRLTRVLAGKPSRIFRLTHTASLHTLAANFHSQTGQTSSVHPIDTHQGTQNEQLYQCYPLDQPV